MLFVLILNQRLLHHVHVAEVSPSSYSELASEMWLSALCRCGAETRRRLDQLAAVEGGKFESRQASPQGTMLEF